MSTLISFTLKSATLCGVREPVDVALRHVGGVPAVEDVGAHVAPVLLVDALAAGRAVAECVSSVFVSRVAPQGGGGSLVVERPTAGHVPGALWPFRHQKIHSPVVLLLG